MNPEKWVDAHGDALYRYALARVRTPSVAEDLVQETFLAALRSQHSYQGNSTERTWLVGILRHKTLDHFRRVSRAQEQTVDPSRSDDLENPFDSRGTWSSAPSSWSSPQESLERDEFWDQLSGCIDTLPESARRSFVLREFEGLDSHTVADMLNVTTNNLWVMLSRARLKLQQCLQRQWFAEGR